MFEGSLLGIQATLVEIGRIRTGRRDERGRPEGLETFRLTSQDRQVLEQAAARYGGTVRPWQTSQTTDRFELVTEADRIPVLVPVVRRLFGQEYELWSGSGLVRRCDGLRQLDPDRSPCACPAANAERARLAAEGQACRPITRLSLFLEGIDLMGVWRLDARGYEAAEELLGSFWQLAALHGEGAVARARLLLTERQRKRDGTTHRYRVPVLVPEHEPARLVALLGFAPAPGTAPEARGMAGAMPAGAGGEPAPPDGGAETPEGEGGQDGAPEAPAGTGEREVAAGILAAVSPPAPEETAAAGAELAAAVAARSRRGRAEPAGGGDQAPADPVQDLRAYMAGVLGEALGRTPPAGELAAAFKTAAGVARVSDFFAARTPAEARAIVDRIAGRIREGADLAGAAAAAAAGSGRPAARRGRAGR